MNELDHMKQELEKLKEAVRATMGVSYKGVKISKYISGRYGIEQFDKIFSSEQAAKQFIDNLKLGSVLYE